MQEYRIYQGLGQIAQIFDWFFPHFFPHLWNKKGDHYGSLDNKNKNKKIGKNMKVSSKKYKHENDYSIINIV